MTTNAAGLHQAQYDPRKYRLRLLPAILAVAVFYLCALLLNADGIKRDIELLNYGPFRDVALSVFNPVAGFSHRLGLTKFRTLIEQSAGNRLHNAKIK
jgi:hypothetical protein